MSTRAESFHAEHERTHGKGPHKPRVARRQPKKAAWSHDKPHAGAKATHALEETAPGTRPSRTSTRSSSNRSKADAAQNRTEEAKKGSPTSLARASRAKATKVRGGGAR
jgi:hypothetical protein